ncbi:MAG: PIN domain-containing protein [Chloroflexi bacterium]|nr:MAG: PIN domain-containing protein [Chloroflexota bacterium]TMG18685.1 MAG: PIN domain-containing protein [Chloroflexota bacterium]
MRVERVFRLLGLLLGLIAGVEYASFIIQEAKIDGYTLRAVVLMLTALAGALFGFFGLPYVTTKPFFWLENKLNVTPLPDLVAATVGLLVGLLLAALVGLFLAKLPWYLGFVISLIVALVFAYWGVTLGLNRRNEMMALVLGPARAGAGLIEGRAIETGVLLDTSVIIDGRIMDIAQTGFLREKILVPHFVLAELQYIADSSDALRRNRGRRGLEVLNLLQKEPLVDIEFIDEDVPDVTEVDMKLIKLAKTRTAAIMTNDYNLNRVAQLEGVRILNLNNLANALKPVVIPGEEMNIQVIKEGKEQNQGVAYLDDGTMIVVENGRRYMNQTIGVIVTSVLQTAAGRMIFATPASESTMGRPKPLRRIQGGGTGH